MPKLYLIVSILLTHATLGKKIRITNCIFKGDEGGTLVSEAHPEYIDFDLDHDTLMANEGVAQAGLYKFFDEDLVASEVTNFPPNGVDGFPRSRIATPEDFKKGNVVNIALNDDNLETKHLIQCNLFQDEDVTYTRLVDRMIIL